VFRLSSFDYSIHIFISFSTLSMSSANVPCCRIQTCKSQHYWDVVLQEYVKPVIQTQRTSEVSVCQNIMYACIDAGLRLLSPFMPFVTEELYQRLPGHTIATSIVVASYPQPCDVWSFFPFVLCFYQWYGDGAGKLLLRNWNALVAAGKGMRAVKLCSNKILHFLTVGAG